MWMPSIICFFEVSRRSIPLIEVVKVTMAMLLQIWLPKISVTEEVVVCCVAVVGTTDDDDEVCCC